MPTDAAPPTIRVELLKGLLGKSIQHVIEHNITRKTAIERELTLNELAQAIQEQKQERYFGKHITLTGGFQCTVILQIPKALARTIGIEYLHYEPYQLDTLEDGDENYQDTCGEFTNMVAGTFRNVLAKAKMECRMTPPQTYPTLKEALVALKQGAQHTILRMKCEDLHLYGAVVTK